MENKLHINTGTIGHVDHGKTTLTLSIINNTILKQNLKKNFLTLKNIDSTKEEILRGITINSTHIEYETITKHYSHIDCPGHLDYIKNMIIGAYQMDIAILVIDINEGPMPQTREHIILSNQLNIKNIIVFLNKEDLVEDIELIELIELEIKELLYKYNYNDKNINFCIGSALKALENLYNNNNYWLNKIDILLNKLDNIIVERNNNVNFLMSIEDIFLISGRGIVITGLIERGIIIPSMVIDIIGYNNNLYNINVIEIEMFKKKLKKATVGLNVGLLLKNLDKQKIKKGMVAAKPNSIKSYNSFLATIYLLTEEEGGRNKPFFKNYSPQFFFRTCNITGNIIEIINKNMVIPGEYADIRVKLLNFIVLENNLKFSIREGKKTIGSGNINKLIKL